MLYTQRQREDHAEITPGSIRNLAIVYTLEIDKDCYFGER